MNLKQIYSSDKNLRISFEVFPQDDTESLFNTFEVFKKYSPKLISLTYGAGGKNKDFSIDIIKKMQTYGFNVMPHFTCICNSKETVLKNLEFIKNLNIKNILALRGDIPEDKTMCCYDFRYANELVEFIKQNSNLSVAVAGYPEGHIEAQNLQTDINYLKQKVDKGADAIYTQLFFDNTMLYKYIEKIRKTGIKTPIIAGIMPILSKKQIDKMTHLAKISLPDEIKNALEKYQNLKEFGIEFATKQCQNLIDNGIRNFHFFTLNKHYSVSKILDNIL